jgi:hypothetical protein
MPLDLASLFDITHALTFLGGTAVGAAGKYMADRFTDQRHKKEAETEARKLFAQLKISMPDLLEAIQNDLIGDETHIREFVVLPFEEARFNHDRPRFEYFETTHPKILNQVSILLSEGYIEQMSNNSCPIYRLKETFVTRLKNNA